VQLSRDIGRSKLNILWSQPPVIVGYVIAVLSVGAALSIALLLDFRLVTAPVSLLLCAIMFSAWVGGVGPGLLSVGLSLLVFDYYFVTPIHSLAMELKEVPRFIIFALSALFVGLLSAAQRRTAESLTNARDDLGETVQELTKINNALQAENTERKRVEEALRRSESYLSEAQRLSHTGSFGWRVSTGEIFWSEETFRIFQCDQTTEPTNELIQSRLHPEDRALVEQTFQDASRKGLDIDFEHRLLMRDGSVKHVHVLAHAERDQSGDIEYVGAVMDITARRQAEEELRKSEKRYRGLLDLSPDAIYMGDADGNLVSANPAGLELLRCTPQEASGMSMAETYLPEELAAFHERVEELNAGARLRYERTFVRKDSTQVPVEVSSSSGYDGYSLGLMRDISERKGAETKLRRSEAYLAEAQKLSHSGSWAGRADLKASTYWSEEMFRIYGFPVSDTPPSNEEVRKYFAPDAWARMLELFENISRKKLTCEGEFPIVLPDGSNRVIRVVGHPVLDASRNIVEFVGTTIDITEQIQARVELEKALAEIKKSEDRLRIIIDTIPTMSWSNQPDGSAVFLSRSWLNYTGLSIEEARGWGWTAALHTDDSNGLIDKWRASVATGQPFEAEARFRGADGTHRWCLCRAVPVRDETGTILQWYGTTTDIEDFKRAEALLAGEKQLLEMIARGDSLALILDALCRLVEELSSGSLSSILLLENGNRLRHGAAPNLPKSYTEAIDGAVIGPSVGSCGTAAYRKEPVIVSDIATDSLWVDYRDLALAHGLRACWSTPILSSDGRMLGTFAIYSRETGRPTAQQQNIIEQVTHLASIAIERKQAEDALQKSQAELAYVTRVMTMGELVASIAHEVNQPLGAIVTNGHACVRLLSREVPDVDKSREVIGRMIKDGMRASEVIKRIRDLLNKKPVETGLVNINETILEVITLVSSEILRSKVELKTDLAADLPAALGDRIQLQQVILNLILNAKDAMSGEQTRKLQITSRKYDSREIVVRVRDTGHGLEEKNVERIFDPFFTTKPEGMGLGLSISQTIIEAHGGRLWATQNEDKGATIQFTLPPSSGSEL
jgi:PAS domain S-box-containing protein